MLTLEPDNRIPALDAIADRGLDAVLDEAGIPGPVENVRLLRPPSRSRRVLYVEANGRPLVVKLFRRDPRPLAGLLERLAPDQSRPGEALLAPPLIAFSRPLRLVATAYLLGPTADQLVRSGSGDRAGDLAGALLERINELPIELGKRYGPDEFLETARKWTDELGQPEIRLASAAEACLERLERARPTKVRYALAHGSFRVRHIFDVGGGAAAIDWDGFCQGPVELDSGYFFATLTHLANNHPDVAPEAKRAALALWTRVAGIVDEDAGRWYEACGLFRIATQIARKQRRAWHARTLELLDLASSIG